MMGRHAMKEGVKWILTMPFRPVTMPDTLGDKDLRVWRQYTAKRHHTTLQAFSSVGGELLEVSMGARVLDAQMALIRSAVGRTTMFVNSRRQILHTDAATCNCGSQAPFPQTCPTGIIMMSLVASVWIVRGTDGPHK